MKIQELVALLNKYPDNLEVVVEYDSSSWLEIDAEEPLMRGSVTVGGDRKRELLIISTGDEL